MSHWTIQSMGIMIKDPLQIVKLTPPRDDERYELTRHIRYHQDRGTVPADEAERMIELVNSPDTENMEVVKALLQEKYHILR